VLPRVRWDRLGRIAMLCVMAVLIYLYLSAGARLFSSWTESKRASAQVSSLERQNQTLRREHTTLASPSTVQEEARRLGMIHAGEQVYSVSGLPPN
jgi:cell division protein FtsB